MKTELSSHEVKVSVDNGVNADGSPARDIWTMSPDQAEKHLALFEKDGVNVVADRDKDTKMPSARTLTKMSAGDVSAIKDAANEFRKQHAS